MRHKPELVTRTEMRRRIRSGWYYVIAAWHQDAGEGEYHLDWNSIQWVESPEELHKMVLELAGEIPPFPKGRSWAVVRRIF